MNPIKHKLWLLLLLFAVYPFTANTAQITTSFTPKMTILPVLNVSVAPLNFGSARTGNTGQLLASTSIIVSNGFSGLPISIGINKGLHTTASTGGTRKAISSTGALMPYTLFRNSTRSLLWGFYPARYSTSISGTTGGMTVYATADYTAALAAGTYTDTLTVTVTY